MENIGITNCSDADIKNIWQLIFIESENILKEYNINENCIQYLAYKNNTNG